MEHNKETGELTQGLFFIIGTGRSGTTLLQSMLSLHSRLFAPPETHFFALFDPAKHFTDPLSDELVEKYLRSCTGHWWWQDLGLVLSSSIRVSNLGLLDSTFGVERNSNE